jgi:hypothetical protein
MRDHVFHDVPILGGMWGCVSGCLPNINDLIAGWQDFATKGCDQRFLANRVWPAVVADHIAHDEFYPSRFRGPPARRFPEHPPYKGFVGEIIR